MPSIRHTSSIFTTLIAGVVVFAPAFSQAADKAPTKAAPQKAADYPRKENGHWDWEQSPDIKSGAVSPALLNYFQTVQKIYDDGTKIIPDAERSDEEKRLAATDPFDVDNFGTISNDGQKNLTHINKVGIFIGGAYWLNTSKPVKKDFFFYGKEAYNGTYQSIAVELGKTLLDPRTRDPKMKLLCAMALEDFVRFTIKMRKGYGTAGIYACTTQNKDLQLLWNEIVSKATGDAAYYWLDTDVYDKEKRSQMAHATVDNLKAAGAQGYIKYLLSTKGENSKLRAEIVALADKELKKQSTKTAAKKK